MRFHVHGNAFCVSIYAKHCDLSLLEFLFKILGLVPRAVALSIGNVAACFAQLVIWTTTSLFFLLIMFPH